MEPTRVQASGIWPLAVDLHRELDGVGGDGTRVEDRPRLPVHGAGVTEYLAPQLFAHVRRDRSEERGVKESHFVASRLVPGGGRLHVVASHGEQVATAPPGFRVVASREHVRVDALEHERLPIFAVQFHPEARREFLAARSIPPGPHDDACFADQARLLAASRDIALAAFAARALPDDPD